MISTYNINKFKQIKYYYLQYYYFFKYALVAQLDRALDYGSGGSGFKS